MSGAAPPEPAGEEPREGRLDPEVADELPGLRLHWLAVATTPAPADPGTQARLAALADRSRGLDAIALRSRPVPRAYRTLYRQIGLDPDVERIPVEAAHVQRLTHGGLRSRDRVTDACLIALLETAVGVWALDRAAVDSATLGIVLAHGALAVADATRTLAPLFGEPASECAPGRRTTEVVLYAVGAPGVPQIHVHEALWLAADACAR